MSPSLHRRGRGSLMARALVSALLAIGAGATFASGKPGNLPLSPAPFAAPVSMLAWVGTGTAYISVDGRWQRAEAHDYEFSVIQRRYAQHWESVKVQQRRHPEYDGSAGAREQTHYFRVDYPASVSGPTIESRLNSSLGDGAGKIDTALREGTLEFAGRGVSMFAPFNHYRIAQQYRYEEGALFEQVELFKRGSGSDVPFMRFEERAILLAPQRMEGAPGPR